ncbi:MAG: hypothetical protein QOF51_1109 [Chloroflexota bacterium]|jgi:DNA-binding GntR family transcriptional regulator|nr:hypothetical protein [Chloroflexota bacterium]
MAESDLFLDIQLPVREEVPAYRALAMAIEERIRGGQLRPGDSLPSHREIATALGISMYTVQHAMNLLMRERFLSGGHGKRTVVADRRAEAPSPRLDNGHDGEAEPPQRLVGTISDVALARDGVHLSLRLSEGQTIRLTTSQSAMAWLHLGPGQMATVVLEEAGIHLTPPAQDLAG